MNELSAIFHRLGIDTADVLEAAATKWNFLNYTPGLVGGHCIGIDPYYLTFRAEKAGYHPEIILAGRRINDGMGQAVARECVRRLMLRKCTSPIVTVLGITFKENVPDLRNSRVIDIVRELQHFGVRTQMHDPMALPEEAAHEYAMRLTDLARLEPADAVILAVAHSPYMQEGWTLVCRLLKGGTGTVLDVKSRLDRASMPDGIDLWRL
jgi:UDP-N-acetyl-D-galactosamine dehydrogenase